MVTAVSVVGAGLVGCRLEPGKSAGRRELVGVGGPEMQHQGNGPGK